MSKRLKEGKNEKSGGLAFFLSLFAFALLGLINSYNLIILFISTLNWSNWRFALLGFIIGAVFARKIITGWISVFLHELRHAVISNLVGNKWKGLVVKSQTGHFEYAYSKKTERFNAFVALAPYWLPMFTVVGGLVSVVAAYNFPTLLIFLISFFYGIDIILNFRDLSPVQSDVTEIRGGYAVGSLYIMLVNLFVFTIYAAWISGGVEGLKYVLFEFWNLLNAFR